MIRVVKNISEGWKTTFLGIIIFLAGLTYLFLPMIMEVYNPPFHYKVDNWILGSSIFLGLGLILLPDTILSGLKKIVDKKAHVVLLILCPMMGSCVTYQKCQDKYGSSAIDPVVITKIDTIVQAVETLIPGDSLFTRIQLDSLLFAKTHDTITIKSTNGRASLQFWKDKYNNYLNAKFTIPPDTIRDTIEIVKQVQIECPPVVSFEQPWYDKYLSWIVAGSVFLIIFTMVRQLFK